MPFGHPAIIIILTVSIWYQPTRRQPLCQFLSKGSLCLDKLVAYCATILHWALTGLKEGGVKFEADVFGPIYKAALARIQQLRSGGAGDSDSVQFLHLVNHLPGRGEELAATL